jgi:hypothetical protein
MSPCSASCIGTVQCHSCRCQVIRDRCAPMPAATATPSCGPPSRSSVPTRSLDGHHRGGRGRRPPHRVPQLRRAGRPGARRPPHDADGGAGDPGGAAPSGEAARLGTSSPPPCPSATTTACSSRSARPPPTPTCARSDAITRLLEDGVAAARERGEVRRDLPVDWLALLLLQVIATVLETGPVADAGRAARARPRDLPATGSAGARRPGPRRPTPSGGRLTAPGCSPGPCDTRPPDRPRDQPAQGSRHRAGWSRSSGPTSPAPGYGRGATAPPCDSSRAASTRQRSHQLRGVEHLEVVPQQEHVHEHEVEAGGAR